MKQFNLDEYLKNPNQKVVTRDGRNVKIHCTNYIGAHHIIAQVEGYDYSTSFTKDGRYANDRDDSQLDLFFASVKHEGWVNIYPNSTLGHQLHKSEEDAKDVADPDVIATVKIEWEE